MRTPVRCTRTPCMRAVSRLLQESWCSLLFFPAEECTGFCDESTERRYLAITGRFVVLMISPDISTVFCSYRTKTSTA